MLVKGDSGSYKNYLYNTQHTFVQIPAQLLIGLSLDRLMNELVKQVSEINANITD